MRTLPDLLRPGLRVVFVGINPGERSARRGHYYGHPGNAFWRVLSASPLVARPVAPEDDATLAAGATYYLSPSWFVDIGYSFTLTATDANIAEAARRLSMP